MYVCDFIVKSKEEENIDNEQESLCLQPKFVPTW